MKNFLKKLFGKKPEPVVPVVPEIVPEEEIDLTKWTKVIPSMPVTNKSEVVDLVTAFNYLIWRTSGSSRFDNRKSAVGELESFIAGETIDLRHIEGLVCTDGVYLIQYGLPSEGVTFTCIRLSTPAPIDPDFLHQHKNELDRLFERHMFKYLADKSVEEFNKIFDESYRVEHEVVVRGCGGSIYKIVPGESKVNYKEDPAFIPRSNIGISFGQSMTYHVNKMIEEAKDVFRHKKNLAAIVGGRPFILFEGLLVNWRSMDEFQRILYRGRPFPVIETALNLLDSKAEWLLSYDGPVFEDEFLPIKFIGF